MQIVTIPVEWDDDPLVLGSVSHEIDLREFRGATVACFTDCAGTESEPVTVIGVYQNPCPEEGWPWPGSSAQSITVRGSKARALDTMDVVRLRVDTNGGGFFPAESFRAVIMAWECYCGTEAGLRRLVRRPMTLGAYIEGQTGYGMRGDFWNLLPIFVGDLHDFGVVTSYAGNPEEGGTAALVTPSYSDGGSEPPATMSYGKMGSPPQGALYHVVAQYLHATVMVTGPDLGVPLTPGVCEVVGYQGPPMQWEEWIS